MIVNTKVVCNRLPKGPTVWTQKEGTKYTLKRFIGMCYKRRLTELKWPRTRRERLHELGIMLKEYEGKP